MSDYIKKEDAAERVAFELMYEAAIAQGLSYKELFDLEAEKQERIKLHILQKWLEQVPSVDVEPVRHGHWEQDGHHIRCSECGTYFCITDREGDSFPINYCPCCGAKMDGKEQE